MKPANRSKLLLAGIGAATFIIGGTLGPSGLSHAFNSAAEFAQFAITGAATVLGAGLGVAGGIKLFTRKGVDGLASIAPGIVGMVFGFAVGAASGNWAGQNLASHIGQHELAPLVQILEEPKTPAPEFSAPVYARI
jgi:hypothetical protein